jgi:3-phenylpropionate/trans-cinnamate dioxygenase ferredoxin reductase subunit
MQYTQLRIDLELGRAVRDLGLDDHRVLLADGKTIGWDLLCIATGSAARNPEGAFTLRELPDADRLKARIDRGESLTILGAGFIGCEVAAVAREKGCEVHVYEEMAQPLGRVLGPELGGFLAQVHRERGVDLRLNATIDRADLVAIGSEPRVALGVAVDRGIVVDELGRTSAPGVFAAGDVTRFYHPLYETHVRVEHFQTAQRQGFAVGRSMAGAPTPYEEAPWFWSDQYDLNLQYVGAGLPWDEVVVRGDLGRPPFTVFYLSGGRLIAAAGINDHHTVARARRVVESRRDVTARQLEDPGFDLRTLGRSP